MNYRLNVIKRIRLEEEHGVSLPDGRILLPEGKVNAVGDTHNRGVGPILVVARLKNLGDQSVESFFVRLKAVHLVNYDDAMSFLIVENFGE